MKTKNDLNPVQLRIFNIVRDSLLEDVEEEYVEFIKDMPLEEDISSFVDSMHKILFCVAVEHELKIKISSKELNDFKTMNDFILIAEKRFIEKN